MNFFTYMPIILYFLPTFVLLKSPIMKIGICSDHAGVDYKSRLIAYLLGKGYEVVNFGTDSTESCDYPDFAAVSFLSCTGEDKPESALSRILKLPQARICL